ncbi:MAG: ribose-phosphate diphosphokinase [Gammaproteobacteria bacterium]|nr:ribose-phosphate diphosphokinase [Gammaproteobacteria bacterium]
MTAREIMYFSDECAAAQRLADTMGIACRCIESHRFPDDELRVRIPLNPAAHVILYRSLAHPNDKLIELLLVVETLREKGVHELSLIAPYLCYMRQDAENTPGEAVSQSIIGRWLANLFDSIYTIDAHLHRTHELTAAVPLHRAVNLTAAQILGEFVRARGGTPCLLGPDEESGQWVQRMAQAAKLDSAVATKVREGDERVVITLPEMDWQGRDVVLVDDVVSSGGTLVTICGMLRSRGVVNIDVAVTHPLFAHDALNKLHRAGVRHIWSTDSIAHPTNSVFLAPLWSTALNQVV